MPACDRQMDRQTCCRSKDRAVMRRAGKNRNVGAQLHSLLYTTVKKYFGKFTSYVSFGAPKLVHSEPFLDSTGCGKIK